MKACVYRHFAADGSLLYVGMTLCLASRLRGHLSDSAWAREISRIEIERYATRKQAAAAEHAAIVSELPRYNRAPKHLLFIARAQLRETVA